MTVFWGFTLLLLGAWFGSMLSDLRWQLNSVTPDLVKIGDRHFKVVRANCELSWSLADAYREDFYSESDHNEQQ